MNFVIKSAFIKNSFYIIIAAAFAAVMLSPLASQNPDGLDWTIEKHASAGLESSSTAAGEKTSAEETGESNYFIFSDYKTPFIKNESVSTIFSGLAGIMLILAFFKFYSAAAKKNTAASRPEAGDNLCR